MAEVDADLYDTTYIRTEATGDYCPEISMQNIREFIWNGPTEGTEIDITCRIDGIDQLTRIGWEDTRLHVGFYWLLMDMNSHQVWMDDIWVQEFSPHAWEHRTGNVYGYGYVTMTQGHRYSFQLFVEKYWASDSYHLAQGSWMWNGERFQDTGGFFDHNAGAAHSWVKTIIYN